MKKLIYLSIFLLMVLALHANTVIAKERAPSNGLYIIGPDISPDSTEHLFLYYSPDGGHTLEVRNRLDWIEFRTFAVDYVDSVIYLTENTRSFRSWDRGTSFPDLLSDGSSECTKSGSLEGCIVKGCGRISFDFGSSYISPVGHGWFGGCNGMVEQDITPNLGYSQNDAGILFYTKAYFDTFEVAFDFGTDVKIFRGIQSGELYAQKSDTIYYSSDYAHSFEIVGNKPPFTMPVRSEIISGNEHAELYAAGYYRNWIESEYSIAGEVWKSGIVLTRAQHGT